MKSPIILGKINEHGQAMLPVTVIAADGLEVEIESLVSLQYNGAMAVSEELARRLGWRKLGARRVRIGFQSVIMDHYLGTLLVNGEPFQTVILGGTKAEAMIGQKFLSDKKMTLDFTNNLITLE
ncbi:MAG: hypothetical protein K2W82_00575 [Candidatus Obscuribacterales bacterium]|nr:hypothetical protein [Candidatus Obscuribacterales bacterium]